MRAKEKSTFGMHFIKCHNTRIALNKTLDIHPYRISYPSVEEYRSAIRQKDVQHRNVSINLSSSDLTNIIGLHLVPWDEFKKANVSINLSNNPITDIPSEFIYKIIDSIPNLKIVNMRGITFSFVNSFLLFRMKSPNLATKLLFDFGSIETIKDKAISDAIKASLSLSEDHKFISSDIFKQGLSALASLKRNVRLDLMNKDFSFLDSIKHIIANNNLNVLRLTGLDSCVNVERIILNDNSLFNYSNHLDTWALPKLVTLNLSNNVYLKEVPNFKGCVNVKYLYLNNTRFYNVDYLVNMKGLERINISNTLVGSITFLTKADFPKLTYINVANLGLTFIDESLIDSPEKLESLDISGNVITLATSPILPGIRYLDLSNVTFTNDVVDLRVSTKLTTFKAVDTNLAKLFLNSKHIRNVHLRGTKVATLYDSGVLSPSFYKLKVLDLSFTLITTIDQLDIIRYIRRDVEVNFKGCFLTKETQRMLDALNKNGWHIEFDKNDIFSVNANVVSYKVK